MTAAPQAKPAPKAFNKTISPALIRPWRRASSNATGIEAADVLPYLSRLTITLFHRYTEPLGERDDDSLIGLMRDH